MLLHATRLAGRQVLPCPPGLPVIPGIAPQPCRTDETWPSCPSATAATARSPRHTTVWSVVAGPRATFTGPAGFRAVGSAGNRATRDGKMVSAPAVVSGGTKTTGAPSVLSTSVDLTVPSSSTRQLLASDSGGWVWSQPMPLVFYLFPFGVLGFFFHVFCPILFTAYGVHRYVAWRRTLNKRRHYSAHHRRPPPPAMSRD